MKKRIFIAIQYLEIGGAERSLVEMLRAVNYERCDIDLFVYRHSGELWDSIPPEVNLLPEDSAYRSLTIPIKEAITKGHWSVAMGRMMAKWKAKRHAKRDESKESIAIFQFVADCTTPFLPSLKKYGRYDLAISYLTPHNIVRDKVDAKEKWAWVHTDYSYVGVDVEAELPVWAAYDKIAAVSEDVAKSFISVFPSLEDKVFVFENILSEKMVRMQAHMKQDAFDLDDIQRFEGVKLCSVGRLSHAKAFDRAVEICRLLVEGGVSLRWYVIGYGGDEPLIRQAITRHGMEKHFFILGKRTNPYPYIAACDIYIQPSRYEGKAVTVREAQILCKPVVITDYATAHSQVKNGIDGVIVPNDADGAAKGLADFIQNKKLQDAIVAHLETHHYGNEEEVEKLYTQTTEKANG